MRDDPRNKQSAPGPLSFKDCSFSCFIAVCIKTMHVSLAHVSQRLEEQRLLTRVMRALGKDAEVMNANKRIILGGKGQKFPYLNTKCVI